MRERKGQLIFISKDRDKKETVSILDLKFCKEKIIDTSIALFGDSEPCVINQALSNKHLCLELFEQTKNKTKLGFENEVFEVNELNIVEVPEWAQFVIFI